MTIDGFGIGIYTSEIDGQPNDILFRDGEIVRSGSLAWGFQGNNVVFEANRFEDNGCFGVSDSQCVFDHVTYFGGRHIQGHRWSRNVLLDNCRQTSNGQCGCALLQRISGQGTVIEDNLIVSTTGDVDFACTAIATGGTQGNSYDESCKDCVIRGNSTRNINRGMEISGIVDSLIENNTVFCTDQANAQCRIMIRTPDNPFMSPEGQSGNTFRNNLVWSNRTSTAWDTQGFLITNGAAGANPNRFVSNVAVLMGNRSGNSCYSFASTSPSLWSTVDYNLCRLSGAGLGSFANGQSISSWRSSTGFDANSTVQDPGFSEPQAGDFRAASVSSAIVGTGHPTLSAAGAAKYCSPASPANWAACQSLAAPARRSPPDRGPLTFGADGGLVPPPPPVLLP